MESKNPSDLTNYKSILCLHGDMPDLTFFRRLNLPLIAADGAANNLVKMGVSPTLILGDLDSVEPDILKQHAFCYLPDQDSSDYQKALAYLKEKNLLPAIIVGINGGYLDHVLNNINIFMETSCLLYAPPLRGFVMQQSAVVRFSLPYETKISLLGIPNALISSKGLKWELKSARLSFPGASSCFNRTQEPEVCLEIHQGAVLVLIYEERVTDAGFFSPPREGKHPHEEMERKGRI